MSETHQMLILLPGSKNGFVKPNYNFTGDPVIDQANLAYLVSGTPLTLTGDLTVDAATSAEPIIGLLVYDASGTSPVDGIGGADQSGVLTYVYGLATVQVPTRVIDSQITFNWGDKVYASATKGKLTNVGSGTPIGTVISTINQASDGLVVQMSI
jgi:hypothetical protein